LPHEGMVIDGCLVSCQSWWSTSEWLSQYLLLMVLSIILSS